jgi:hypothetical protein
MPGKAVDLPGVRFSPKLYPGATTHPLDQCAIKIIKLPGLVKNHSPNPGSGETDG